MMEMALWRNSRYELGEGACIGCYAFFIIPLSVFFKKGDAPI